MPSPPEFAVPLLQIGGAVAMDKRDAGDLQDMETFKLMEACSKWAKKLTSTSRIPEYVSMAFRHALDGAPGVRTKRFAPDRGLAGQALDDANNAHLVERLASVPPERRTARYVCVAAFVAPGSEPVLFRGEAPGVVIHTPTGAGGFGYGQKRSASTPGAR